MSNDILALKEDMNKRFDAVIDLVDKWDRKPAKS